MMTLKLILVTLSVKILFKSTINYSMHYNICVYRRVNTRRYYKRNLIICLILCALNSVRFNDQGL